MEQPAHIHNYGKLVKTALHFRLVRSEDATMEHSKPTILKPHSIFDFIWSVSVFIFYYHFHYCSEFGASSKLNVVKLLLATAQVGDSLANCPSPLARGIILLLLFIIIIIIIVCRDLLGTSSVHYFARGYPRYLVPPGGS